MEGGLLQDKGLIASLSLFSLALAAGVFFNRSSEHKEQAAKEEAGKYEVQQTEINEQLDNLNNLQSILLEKAEEIQLAYMPTAPNVLTPQCLQEILDFTSTTVDSAELETIYANNRKARRTCFKELKSNLGQGTSSQMEIYYRFVCTFEEQIQYLIEKAQKDFIIFLDIDYSVFNDSIAYHQCDAKMQEWFRDWAVSIKEQLREKLKLYNQPVTPAQVLDIINFQIQALTEEGGSLKNAVFNLQLESEEDHEPIPAFLQCFIEDLVFQKYGCEYEQVNIMPSDISVQLSEKFHILSSLRLSIEAQMKMQVSQSEEGVSEEWESG